MDNNIESAEIKKTEELFDGIQDSKFSERSRQLIGQMKGKLEQCERKAIERINELDIVLGQDGIKDRAQDEIKLWQEKYILKQELKEDNFKNKILDRLKKWSV